MDRTRTERIAKTFSTALFWTCQILAHIAGIALLVSTGVWLSKYFGGFHWGKVPGTFSYHAFFGTLGLVVICGEAILFIEVPKRLNLPVIVQKAIHATIHTCAFIFTITSLSAAVTNKNAQNGRHLYSLHSWLGLIAVLVFFLQYVVACVMYGMARVVGDWLTDLYQNTHAYTGLLTFGLAIAACLTGFMEVIVEQIKNFKELPPAAVLANVCCLLMVLFGMCVAYGASRPNNSNAQDPSPEADLEEHNLKATNETDKHDHDAGASRPNNSNAQDPSPEADLEEQNLKATNETDKHDAGASRPNNSNAQDSSTTHEADLQEQNVKATNEMEKHDAGV